MEEQIIDGEKVGVIKTEPMALEPLVARGNTELMESDIGKRKKNLTILLKLIQPGQLMRYGDSGKETLYLTAGGADVALRSMGLRFGHKTVKISKDDDGVTAIAEADLLKPDGSYYEHFIGIRRMLYDDQASGGIKGYIKNEPDLIRSALANLTHSAGMQLLGLRMLSPADCKDIGIDLDKLDRHVDFQDHADHNAKPIKFGRGKGKTIAQQTDADLGWYIEAVKQDIANPDKAKFKKYAEKQLAELEAEKAKRLASAQEEFGYGPPPMGDDRQPGAEG